MSERAATFIETTRAAHQNFSTCQPNLNAIAILQSNPDNLMVITDSYFETGQPIIDEESNVGKSDEQTSYGWSHSLGEIVTSLISAGLRIEFLHEHRTAGEDWSWLLPMRQRKDERWELIEGRDTLPLEYSIRAIREN